MHTTLPPEIEEAIERYGIKSHNYAEGAVQTIVAMDRLRALILAALNAASSQQHPPSGPSQRQRYMESAIAGMLANPDVFKHPSYSRDGMIGEAAAIADEAMAENAQHAAKEGKP